MKYSDDIKYSGLAIVCAALLALGACGSDDSGGSSTLDSLQTSLEDTAAATGDMVSGAATSVSEAAADTAGSAADLASGAAATVTDMAADASAGVKQASDNASGALDDMVDASSPDATTDAVKDAADNATGMVSGEG